MIRWKTQGGILPRLAMAAGALGLLGAGGALSPARAAGQATVTWGYFQGGISSPGAVIATQKSLEAMIPAKLKFIQINSGVAALAAMRAGSFDVVEGVGNPPVVGALAAHTPLVVVFAESYDGAALYVNSKVIKKPADLAGQKIGDLVGSSEDYELKGYLKHVGMENKVTVVPFSSQSAAAAAFLAGNLNAVYVDFGSAVPMMKRPTTKMWTTAADIAQLGYPSMNVLVVSKKIVQQEPKLVQKIVCAVSAASDDMVGPQRAKYFATSAAILGVPADVAVKGSEQWPELTLKDQAEWFGAPGTKIIDSKIVQQAYVKSAAFLKKSGAVLTVPSAATIADAVDPSFVRAASNGACK